jgi:hypothetical protein
MYSEIINVKINKETGEAVALSGNLRLIAQLKYGGSVEVMDIDTNKYISIVLRGGKAVKATLN